MARPLALAVVPGLVSAATCPTTRSCALADGAARKLQMTAIVTGKTRIGFVDIPGSPAIERAFPLNHGYGRFPRANFARKPELLSAGCPSAFQTYGIWPTRLEPRETPRAKKNGLENSPGPSPAPAFRRLPPIRLRPPGTKAARERAAPPTQNVGGSGSISLA